MKDGVRLVEEAFRQHASGTTQLAPRLVMPLRGDAGNFRIMASIVPEIGGFGLKTLTGTPGKRAADSNSVLMCLKALFSNSEWTLFQVGFPAKSGVSGLVFGAVPGVMGISLYSPLIDRDGTSTRATEFLARLSKRLVLGVFDRTQQHADDFRDPASAAFLDEEEAKGQ